MSALIFAKPYLGRPLLQSRRLFHTKGSPPAPSKGFPTYTYWQRTAARYGVISLSRPLEQKHLTWFKVLKRKYAKFARYCYRNYRKEALISITSIFFTNLAACLWWTTHGGTDTMLQLLRDLNLHSMFERYVQVWANLLERDIHLDDLNTSTSGQLLAGWIMFSMMEGPRWCVYYALAIILIRRRRLSVLTRQFKK